MRSDAVVDAVAASVARVRLFHWRIERSMQGRWVTLATRYRAADWQEGPAAAVARYQRVRPVTRDWQLRAIRPAHACR